MKNDTSTDILDDDFLPELAELPEMELDHVAGGAPNIGGGAEGIRVGFDVRIGMYPQPEDGEGGGKGKGGGKGGGGGSGGSGGSGGGSGGPIKTSKPKL